MRATRPGRETNIIALQCDLDFGSEPANSPLPVYQNVVLTPIENVRPTA